MIQNKISILMPIKNGIEFINESVNSIINQTFDNWELIIGINGHIINSQVFNIAKTFENNKIFVYDMPNITSKSDALNEMLQYCNYDYIALLDVDDIWENEKLMIQSEFINDYDVVGSRCIYFGDKQLIPFVPGFDITNFDFFKVNPVVNSSAIIRKHLCHWCNIDNEDYDLWIRLKQSGATFYNCNQALVKHRIHSKSAFNSKNISNDAIYKKYNYKK